MTDRELDAAVAEKVMGARKEDGWWRGPWGTDLECQDTGEGLPRFSSTGDGMLAVVEAMEKKYGLRGHNGFTLMKIQGSKWYCEFPTPNWMDAVADAAPRAVVLAALRAVGEGI